MKVLYSFSQLPLELLWIPSPSAFTLVLAVIHWCVSL
jgi:hypothetical protein